MPGVTMNDTLEEYRDAISTQDTHKKLKVADDLIEYLSDTENEIQDTHATSMIDGLVGWVSSSNFKVSQKGLEILSIIAVRVGPNISKGHMIAVLAPTVDRLGDSKQVVREEAMDLIFKFMDPVSTPQVVFEILGQYFNHKNWRVREVLMICLSKAINQFGASSIQLNKITPHLVKLLADPTGQVRDTAVATMVEVYRHVGERFRLDVSKRNIPEAKLNGILAKFDKTQADNLMDSSLSSRKKCISSNDVTDGNSTTEKKKAVRSAARRSASFAAGDKKKNAGMPERGVSAGASGALDETDFMTAWEEVQDARLFSIRDFPSELDKVKNTLSNTNNDWEKRVEALRHMRSLIKISGQVDNFTKMMKDMENALRVSVKDLRSSVVREACITLSYCSYIMENKFEYLAENLLPNLIILIPNSVKIMSSSGHAALRLIIKNTSTPRIIPVIVSNLLSSKSKEIRRRSAEYLGLLLEVWATPVLKGHVALIEEAIRKGISDADSEARAAVRRVYWHFADHYKSRADIMMQSFDTSKQKLLQSDKNLISAGVISQPKPTHSLSNMDLTEGSKKKPVRSKMNNGSSRRMIDNDMAPPAPSMQRSASQLEYKHKNAPVMTPRQKSYDDMKRNTVRATPREGRPRYAQRGAASQPSSRTASPKRMPTLTRERSEDYMKTYNTQKTRIPTPAKATSSKPNSRVQSRDHSPVRLQHGGNGYDHHRGTRNGHGHGAPQTDVTEDALWTAWKKQGQRERCSSQNSVNGAPGSDESDNSSQSSLNSQQKRNVLLEFDEILKALQHDSPSGRRDGLLSLQAYLNSIKSLSTTEARTTRDVFNRYFAESNSKVYSLFLDVLSEFIVQYKNELQDWLFILLTRLLQRISSEMLPSAQTKIAMVLDVVRDSYPYDHQFQIITKYITDNTQSPTIKMKVKLLQYLTGLISLMDASDFTNSALIRLAVSRIVTWISEPKSPEVRKEATAVIIALFQLNSAEFSMLLSNVPNSIQEGATRAIQLRLKTAGVEKGMANLALSNDNSPPSNNTQHTPIRKGSVEDFSSRKPTIDDYRTQSPVKLYRDQRTNSIGGNENQRTNSYGDNGSQRTNSYGDNGSQRTNSYGDNLSQRTNSYNSDNGSQRTNSYGDNGISPLTDFQANNPREDFVDGIEHSETPTTRIPHSSSVLTSRYTHTTPHTPQNDTSSYNSPHVNMPTATPVSESNIWLTKDTPPSSYNPRQYEDTLLNQSPAINRVADGAEHPDGDGTPETDKNMMNLFNQISTVLCNPKDSNDSEDIKSALHELNKLIRSWDKQMVSPMLKVILPDVLAQLKHNEATIRCLAARSLREVASSHPDAYRSNLNSFILPLFETEADNQKEVAKTAEECCTIVSQTLSADEVLPVISPLVGSPSYPVNVSAIKMLNVICDSNCEKHILMKHVDVVVSNLLRAYDHSESSARKAAVFCLVSVHNLAGAEVVTPYFKDLAGSKFKLLNLYIRRSQSTNI